MGKWSIPAPSRVLDAELPGGEAVKVRCYGNSEGPRLLLSHGCGLASDAYFPFWSLLLDEYEILAFDFRSHGWNEPTDLRDHTVATFVEDYESILSTIPQVFGHKPTVGIFHSLSALTAIIYEQVHGGFDGLVLFDPPIRPPGGDPSDLERTCHRLAVGTRRRKWRFDSPREYAFNISANPLYGRLQAGVPDLMAQTLLRLSDGGTGYELRCPRHHEAQIFERIFEWSMQVDISKVKCPVKIVGSDPTVPFPFLTFMPATSLDGLMDVGYDFVPLGTHLLQLEEPERCVEMTIEALESWGFA